ncbi:MAG: undecaprenyl/decaprenyl-phosphate alpha-N-acetylglucosaminyl 1-phosphate transferase [Dysgonamonadaceae bacterium]|jgi:UDP-N-acetylmuramyl pentapeptide phosphotransferase/UDP-N-acetylglucosamine-1-phosphate transferase|nr:undecaprenyl/decaprenyl-phosphate alpha-N-acetylglucosaminyl 1-phosphate transferase [Dysgonamonadaceae bacterium]
MYNDETMLLAFVASVIIAVFSTDHVIGFSNRQKMVDAANEERKIHKKAVPNLGGVCVFMASMFTYFAFSGYSDALRPDKLFSISILLFFIGVKDDMEPVAPWRRLAYEFLCAFFIIYITDIRITNLYGIFFINVLPYWTSFALTSVFIVACINAYNMIDGIDGLLGSLSLLGAITFGVMFYESGEWLWALLCVSISGALVGFLIFNWQSAKIFMGNGGSMFMGTIFACISLRVMQLETITGSFFAVSMPVTIALGVIAVPIFDMLSVFVIRIFHKQSPFKADRRHTHHKLLDLGLQHWQAVLVLVFTNILIIGFAYWVQGTGALRSILLTFGFCIFLALVLFFIHYIKFQEKTIHS